MVYCHALTDRLMAWKPEGSVDILFGMVVLHVELLHLVAVNLPEFAVVLKAYV